MILMLDNSSMLYTILWNYVNTNLIYLVLILVFRWFECTTRIDMSHFPWYNLLTTTSKLHPFWKTWSLCIFWLIGEEHCSLVKICYFLVGCCFRHSFRHIYNSPTVMQLSFGSLNENRSSLPVMGGPRPNKAEWLF